jgi:hypothetical protein
MTQRIPLVATPAQRLSVTLGTQRCTITVYQRSTGMYFDLYLAGVPVTVGMICRDRVSLVRAAYASFVGRLAFIDTLGVTDPTYDGLGGRYQLVYIP